MVAVITNKLRLHVAQQFKENFVETDGNNSIYLAIGRSAPWTDENSPPLPIDSFSEQFANWNEMIAFKKIEPTRVSFITKRHTYVPNTVYTAFDDQDPNLFNTSFYVLTPNDFNVYKCIDNNNGAPSTSQPTGQGTTIITTADNYKWKFMYNIPTADVQKFLTNEWMPVKTIGAPLVPDDLSPQWDVENTAIDGGIHLIKTLTGGTGFTTATITITGDGTGATATATIVGGVITKIDISNPGTGYHTATITITGDGTGATAVAVLSPEGGHGKDATEELGGFFVVCNIVLDGNDGLDFPVIGPNSDFRRLQLIRGLTEVGGLLATQVTYQINEIKKFTGDILYTENRRVINRALDQLEEIFLILEF